MLLFVFFVLAEGVEMVGEEDNFGANLNKEEPVLAVVPTLTG